ncbi:MAG: class I SAM-dependent methyltransferase [Gemmatimonadetes bacterium]|nr:MAG: class I SAM-dependent methyltransferase [Gemmatimonadota bacterium]
MKKTIDPEARKHYWNDTYYQYWKARVEEANQKPGSQSTLVKNDNACASDQIYFDAIDSLNIHEGANILEMGCGFGRSIPFLYTKTQNIYAIDISQAMVDAAKETCQAYEHVQFKVVEAEHTGFDSDFFDHVICYAMFDTTYQNQTLLEINRVLKTGGTVLITGKNDRYFADDEHALIAEKNARKKGHPNYFTDIPLLFSHLDDFGFSLVSGRYYHRRGDFAKNNYTTEMPAQFYEYMIVLQKIKSGLPSAVNLPISDLYSKTYQQIQRDIGS